MPTTLWPLSIWSVYWLPLTTVFLKDEVAVPSAQLHLPGCWRIWKSTYSAFLHSAEENKWLADHQLNSQTFQVLRWIHLSAIHPNPCFLLSERLPLSHGHLSTRLDFVYLNHLNWFCFWVKRTKNYDTCSTIFTGYSHLFCLSAVWSEEGGFIRSFPMNSCLLLVIMRLIINSKIMNDAKMLCRADRHCRITC